MKVTEFTIDRSKWQRGKAPTVGDVALLNMEDGKMCCLGFYAKACGLTDEQIANRAYPASILLDLVPPSLDWLREEVPGAPCANNSKEAMRLVDINDHRTMTEEDREGYLTKAFADNGVKVMFVDGEVAA